MPAAERRSYAGAAPITTLSSGINNSTTSIPVTNGTGYPDGSVGPFFIVIDKGLAGEEKVKCVSRSGNTITAVTSTGRGSDGTSAASHSSGATVEHVLTADDMDLMNIHIASVATDNHTQYLNEARHDVLLARHDLLPWGVLGKASDTSSSQTMASSTPTDITDMTVTVTAGTDRVLKITAQITISADTANNEVRVTLWEGATPLQTSYKSGLTAGAWGTHSLVWYGEPSAGSHTYKLMMSSGDGTTIQVRVHTSGPAILMVEDVGPA